GDEPFQIITMRDRDGHEIVWKTGSIQSVETGDQIAMTGRVKAHTQYQGVDQTEISRAKLKKPSQDGDGDCPAALDVAGRAPPVQLQGSYSVWPPGRWIVPVPVQLLPHPDGALIQRTGDLAVTGPGQPGAFDRPFALEGDPRTLPVDLPGLLVEQDRLGQGVGYGMLGHGGLLLHAASLAAVLSLPVALCRAGIRSVVAGNLGSCGHEDEASGAVRYPFPRRQFRCRVARCRGVRAR